MLDDNNPKVSVIIPVYNVEKYIPRCLESVLSQTIQDIEIILLNDGSTDSSEEICKAFEKQDNRVKYFSHSNRGLGETRNRGIDLAKGDYLFFVDSDDYLETGYIEALYNTAVSESADIVQGESKMLYEESGNEVLESDLSGLTPVDIDHKTSKEFMRTVFFPHVYKHYAWNKIYKASFIKDHNIRFGDNKRIFAEDTWFQLQTFHYDPHIAFSSGTYYFYLQRATSIMHSSKKDLLRRQGTMIDDYCGFLKDHNGSDLEKKICDMISMDVFTMEALNQINIGGGFREFRNAIDDIQSYSAIYDSVCGFIEDKAGELEINSNRRMYLRTVSLLYKCKLDYLAQLVIWTTYKIIRGI